MSGQKKRAGGGGSPRMPREFPVESDVYRYNLVLAEWKACFFGMCPANMVFPRQFIALVE